MAEENKVIKDKKTIYLARTLSRTKRKDYENYVINAVWNRLKNNNLEVVSQQYILDLKNKKHFFIDLYFPSINVGIEVDEKEKNDKDRDVSIYDVLYQVKSTDYILKRIDVTTSFDELEKQINNTVECINKKIKEIKPPKWEIVESAKFCAKKEEITIWDKINFDTIDDVCNILFSANYKKSKGAKKAFFIPKSFHKTEYEGYKVWFPHLAIKDENEKLISPTESGFINILLKEGKEIIEYNEKIKMGEVEDNLRIVFAKDKDPLGKYGYRFVGIFKPGKFENGERCYKRICESCKIIR
jgi:hypothetical protein